jgi:hypothetical protein
MDGCMIRKPWMLAVFFLAFSALAQDVPTPVFGRTDLGSELRGNRCAAKVIQKLDTWETQRSFKRAASAFDGAMAFRTPTRKVGQWIEVDLFPDHSVIAYRVTPLSVTRTTFEGRNCQPQDKDVSKLVNQNRMRKAFSDADVKDLVDGRKNAIIYAWSPHMPYSVRAFENAKAAADQLGFEFVPVLDSRAQGRMANDAMQSHSFGPKAMKRIESIELLFRGITNQFPSVLVVKAGRISRRPYPGFKTQKQYESFIQQENP